MPSKPNRIASLLASATEILYGLGLGEQVVAVSHECDYPPQVRDKPRVTFSHIDGAQTSGAIDQQVHQRIRSGEPLYEINRPRLLELEPDLIVTQSQCDVCAVRYQDVVDLVRCEGKLAGAQVVHLNPMSLDELYQDILRVGAAAAAADEAERMIASLRQRVERIRAGTRELDAQQRPRVACIEWIEPLMLAANWMPELIQLAGGRTLTEAARHSGYSAWDDLIRFDPQVLVVMPCGFDLQRSVAESAVLRGRPGWDDLSAVRQGRVYAVDGSGYFNRSGPRLVDSLEILAHLLHPSRFPDHWSPNAAWAPV